LALDRELNSHILFVPILSGYLAWLKVREAPVQGLARSPWWAAALAAAGMVWLAAASALRKHGWPSATEDWLCLNLGVFVLLLVFSGWIFYGGQVIWRFAGPILIFLFLIPFPRWLESGMESVLQHASAEGAAALLQVSGIGFLRNGVIFRLPGITLEVARECSGLRSTLILFLTSLVAGELFLSSPWRRVALALVVLPLGVLRNSVRIFTIGMLCVHVDPGMIDSWIHRKGGPLFFVLSLGPLFGLLFLLRRAEWLACVQNRRAHGIPQSS
jgi:exosortase C (VPDSG-CTERM-specific)